MRPTTAPMPEKTEMYSDEKPATRKEQDWYKSVVCSLGYYVPETLWHMACEVNLLQSKLQQPTTGAIKALKRVLAYLIGNNKNHRLEVPRVKGNAWQCYVDADHAGNRKYGDARSRSAVLLTLNGMPIERLSKKQAVTATSSASSETVPMTEGIQIQQLRLWIAEELGQIVTWPAKIYSDSTSAISFQGKMCPRTKMRGMHDLREAWIQELKEKRKVKAVKIDTDKNIADMLSKPLRACVREKLLGRLKYTQNLILAKTGTI